MEIPNDEEDTSTSGSRHSSPWYIVDGGWDRIDVLGIRRDWACSNPEPIGWLLWRPNDVPLEARRQTIPGLEHHAAALKDIQDQWCENRAWRRHDRYIAGPTPRSVGIMDQKGGWDRMDRLGLCHQWVRDHPRAPRGWLLWQPENVPLEARVQDSSDSDQEPTIPDNTNKARMAVGKQSHSHDEDNEIEDCKPAAKTNEDDTRSQNSSKPKTLWEFERYRKDAASNIEKTKEEGKTHGGESPRLQHEFNLMKEKEEDEAKQRRRGYLKKKKWLKKDMEREVCYLARRGVFLKHDEMPSSIYSNTTIELSDVTELTKDSVGIIAGEENERAEDTQTQQPRADSRMDEGVDTNDGVALIMARLIPINVAVRSLESTSELSYTGEDSSDDFDCNKKKRAIKKRNENRSYCNCILVKRVASGQLSN